MKMSLPSSSRKHDRSVRRSRHARPTLEGLEDRLVLSLVAVSPSDAKINVTLAAGPDRALGRDGRQRRLRRRLE